MTDHTTIASAPPPLTDPGTVDFIRTGPGTLAGTYLRRFWQPIYPSRNLQPGRSFPLTIMSQKLALYRSQKGKVHCVENRCAHRGSMLSTGWIEGDVIRCPYHGWAYSADGQCVHQPMERAGFAQNIKIGGYPTQEYLGFIWVYLGEGEPPALPRYPEWENAKFVSAQIDTRGCNWFQNVENYQDEGHVWFTHQRSALEGLNLKMLPKLSSEKTPWGLRQIATTPDGRERVVQFGMPNICMFAVHPDNVKRQGEARNADETAWQMFLDFRVPVDDETHLQVHTIAVFMDGEPREAYKKRWDDFAKAEVQAHEVAGKVLRGELPYNKIAELCHHVPLAQDEVVQVGQGVIADRRHGIEHLGASDIGIVAIRRLYAEELTALAEGRPLHNWERPLGLLPKGGGAD
jgi:5,5'-dehydrodivanillate O-demethylase oxygenase subunit